LTTADIVVPFARARRPPGEEGPVVTCEHALAAAARVVALVVVLLTHAVARAATTQPATRPVVRLLPEGRDAVTLQLSRAGPLLLARGAIDGTDAGWFVVDTGASGIFLDPGVAKRFNLTMLGATRAHAVGGMVAVETATCARFELGDRRAGDDAGAIRVERPIIRTGNVAGIFKTLVGADIAGMAGGEVLAGCPFTLDFRDETLTFHAPRAFKPPPATQPHEMRIVRETPAVKLTLDGRHTGWFQIDTGAMGRLTATAMFLAHRLEMLDEKRPMASVSFGAGGRQDQFSVRFPTVTMLGRTFDDVEATYSLTGDDTSFREVLLAGHVGTGLLHGSRLTFDYASSRVWAEPQEREPTEAFVARVKAMAARSLTKETAIYLAARRGRDDALRVLLESGGGGGGGASDVNTADASGFRPIMVANDACAALLIERGADVKAQAAVMGLSALYEAAEAGDLALVKRLLAAGADANVRTTLNETPLLRAAEGGFVDVAAALLDADADAKIARKSGETPLMLAASHGDVAMLTLLLDRGRADVNQKTDDGRTALASAVTAPPRRGTAAVRLLLSRGANVNVPYARSTALHQAVMHGNPEAAALLIAAGADVDAKDREGKTPLDRAIAGGRSDVLRALLEARETGTTRPAR
jgi:ankyrin repeat protein